MSHPVQTTGEVTGRWARLRVWILRVLDASVIEVSDGHYVGSI